jgi:egghead protein (zeste-white 4 protein)
MHLPGRLADPFLVVQFTTRSGPAIVQEVIDSVHSSYEEAVMANDIYRNIKYRVDVVMDEGRAGPRTFEGASLVVVPTSYRTKKGSRYKCRALEFATEKRDSYGENTREFWVFHLDEESMVTRQSMESIMNYMLDPMSPPIAEGPIIYPRLLIEVNPICRVVESLRPYICYDCVSMFDGRKLPIHMHGSNLLVRSDIESEMGWDTGNPASEDQRFGQEAWLKYGPTVFGWHGGMIEEQPPISVGQMIKQRRRWLVGNFFNLMTVGIPFSEKLEITVRWLLWCAGFLSGIVSVIAFIIPQVMPLYIRALLIGGTFLWFFGYQEGLMENLRPLKLPFSRRLYYHLEALVLTPVAGLLETFAAFSAAFFLEAFEWEPTEKAKLENVMVSRGRLSVTRMP